MSIPPSFIQDLVARADIVELIGRYVPLRKGGANLMGLCPFHSEKSPSFTVSPTKQFFHCFGCGKSGNALGFMMEHLGMGYVEAIKDLAQQCGMQVPDDDTSPEDRARAASQRQKQNSLSELLEKAGEAYRGALRDTPVAVDYLKRRGLSGSVARDFGLGYAPEGWRNLASIFPDYTDPLLVESGMVILTKDETSGEDKRWDRFRDRIMFPIRNVKGECIGFGGRVLGDGTPKYLNSPETPVFSKGRELYGLFEARNALREKGYALVTEGYMDVVALAQWGFPNAVATLGTACTADHIQKLFRFTDSVVFSFDGDGAGRRAARKALDAAIPYATDLRNVKFLFLPAEHDPDSFIRQEGQEAFASAVAQALPLSRFLIEAVRDGCEAHSAEGRAKMASQAKPLWNALPEGVLKRQLLADIAQLVQLSGTELQTIWQPTAYEASALAAGRLRPPAARPGVNTNANAHQTYGENPPIGNNSIISSYDYGINSTPAMSPNDEAYWAGTSHAHSEPIGYRGHNGGHNGEHNGEHKGGGGQSDWLGTSTKKWTPKPGGGYGNSSGGGTGKWSRSDKWGKPEVNQGPRVRPTSREDQAARLLLSQSHAWEHLSSEEHSLLCGLPPPHGALFTWLDSHHHEQGPLPWGSLSEAMQGRVFEPFARQLMAATPEPALEPEAALALAQARLDEQAQELTDVMQRLMLNKLEKEKERLIRVIDTELGAREKFADVLRRWNALKRVNSK